MGTVAHDIPRRQVTEAIDRLIDNLVNINLSNVDLVRGKIP